MNPTAASPSGTTGSNGSSAASTPSASGAATGQQPDFAAMMNMMQMMQGMNPGGAGAAGTGTGAASTNPEELYSSQLQKMNEMGFTNREQNLRALQATMGNVNAAVERIFSGLS